MNVNEPIYDKHKVKEHDENNQKRIEELDERSEERVKQLSIDMRAEKRAHFDILSKQLNCVTEICLHTINAIANDITRSPDSGISYLHFSSSLNKAYVLLYIYIYIYVYIYNEVPSTKAARIEQQKEQLLQYAEKAQEMSDTCCNRETYIKALEAHIEECRAQGASYHKTKIKGVPSIQADSDEDSDKEVANPNNSNARKVPQAVSGNSNPRGNVPKRNSANQWTPKLKFAINNCATFVNEHRIAFVVVGVAMLSCNSHYCCSFFKNRFFQFKKNIVTLFKTKTQFVLQHWKFLFKYKQKRGERFQKRSFSISLKRLLLLNMKLLMTITSTLITLKSLSSRTCLTFERKQFVTKRDNVSTFGSITKGKEEFSNHENEINYLSAINPSDNKKFAQFEICNEKLLNECIINAKKVWKKTRIEERKEIITKCIKRIREELGDMNNIHYDDDGGDDIKEIKLTKKKSLICSNDTRVYVHYNILDSFLENLLQQISLLKIDNPCYLNTHIGLLIYKNHLQKDLLFLLTSSNTTYFEQNIEIVKEEIFGHVMTILPFKTESEVIQRVNHTKFGLATGILTQDPKKQLELLNLLMLELFILIIIIYLIHNYHLVILNNLGLIVNMVKKGLFVILKLNLFLQIIFYSNFLSTSFMVYNLNCPFYCFLYF
ncbi:betaine aldehyde dehydrogenase [Reticulomyxa filosa]|uniref:Betaine aldehyde dehydrogenase n=1 Tax=Reticulomyxa filosa TaxID=46433 RepID=X6NZA9_RETFI|nr:betaine aldehyde dehydrogenase [Reticulomyxa filosa]|eukprot:ETO31645.1 betaine aldehyde dehydrogenase [Reticulomyxa filosa]